MLHPSIKFVSTGVISAWMAGHGFPGGLVGFVAAQPTRPFHILPREYPFLSLLAFSPPLIVPSDRYQAAFAIEMALIMALGYALLRIFRSRGAALAFLLYLALGTCTIAELRFDLLPALLTLGVLLCTQQGWWKRAFVLLALAILLKFYPLVLLPPLLLAQQMSVRAPWYHLRRWSPLIVCVLVCAVVTIVSLLLSVEGTLAPLAYFVGRPIQIESPMASVLWLLDAHGLRYVNSYGSINVLSAHSSPVALSGTALLLGGLLYTWWLQWRKKIDLSLAFLLTLLVVMLTSKVFSPQYLIWLAPLVAYTGRSNWRWLLCWSLVCLITTFIFPLVYSSTPWQLLIPRQPAFYPATLARNLLLLCITLNLLISVSYRGARSL
jgi:hypothetical protein